MTLKKNIKKDKEQKENVWCDKCKEFPKMSGHTLCYKCEIEQYKKDKEERERMINKGWY